MAKDDIKDWDEYDRHLSLISLRPIGVALAKKIEPSVIASCLRGVGVVSKIYSRAEAENSILLAFETLIKKERHKLVFKIVEDLVSYHSNAHYDPKNPDFTKELWGTVNEYLHLDFHRLLFDEVTQSFIVGSSKFNYIPNDDSEACMIVFAESIDYGPIEQIDLDANDKGDYYIKKVNNDFYYKAHYIKLDKEAKYYMIFCSLYALIPKGGEIKYSELIKEIWSRTPSLKSKSDEEMKILILNNITSRKSGLCRKARFPATEDGGKPLIEVIRSYGIRFNNKMS